LHSAALPLLCYRSAISLQSLRNHAPFFAITFQTRRQNTCAHLVAIDELSIRILVRVSSPLTLRNPSLGVCLANGDGDVAAG
jgi:hypothetical protein